MPTSDQAEDFEQDDAGDRDSKQPKSDVAHRFLHREGFRVLAAGMYRLTGPMGRAESDRRSALITSLRTAGAAHT